MSSDRYGNAKAWLELSDLALPSNKPKFFNFVCSWIAFNNLYNELYGLGLTDRAKIEKVKADKDFCSIHARLLGENLYRESIAYLKTEPVVDMKSKKVSSISNIQNWSEILEAVYIVRNNLFHGSKNVTEKRDHDRIVAASTIVAQVVTAYLG